MSRFAGTELGNYMSSPDFTGIGRTMLQGASLGRKANAAAEGRVAISGINSAAKIKGAEHEAKAIVARGAAQAPSPMSYVGDAIGALSQGFGAMGSGGGSGDIGASVSSAANNGAFSKVTNLGVPYSFFGS